MKITNINLINLLNTLNTFTDKKLPQKISYAITKNIMALNKESEIYQKQLEKILQSYSEFYVKDSEGNVIKLPNGLPEVDTEHKENFDKEITELLSFEVDIDLYSVSEEVFDYDDTSLKYDILTVNEILLLQSVMCKE